MRTAEGVSPNVAGGETVFTLLGFAGMYFLLGVLFVYLVLREIAMGPTRERDGAAEHVAGFVGDRVHAHGVRPAGRVRSRRRRRSRVRGARPIASARPSMASIGPFWNGNEVWLIAAGGALFALFPKAYASSFSGFYLPFIVVLWLLMFRGIAMELRNALSTASCGISFGTSRFRCRARC